jgi:hypothetical protein
VAETFETTPADTAKMVAYSWQYWKDERVGEDNNEKAMMNAEKKKRRR